jgi:type VI protein secretion system component Hcp
MADDSCDGYLKLIREGQPVKGEATDEDFPELIELMSFEIGSMSGFEDSYYAVQKVSERRQSSLGRMRESVSQSGGGVRAMAKGFENLDTYEGKDLSEQEACQFQIIKQLDWSSADLFQAYCSVQNPEKKIVFESAVLSLRKTTGGKEATYLEFHFTDVAVAQYTLEISSDAKFRETISFSFGACRMEYKPQTKTGGLESAVKAGWSFLDRGEW